MKFVHLGFQTDLLVCSSRSSIYVILTCKYFSELMTSILLSELGSVWLASNRDSLASRPHVSWEE